MSRPLQDGRPRQGFPVARMQAPSMQSVPSTPLRIHPCLLMSPEDLDKRRAEDTATTFLSWITALCNLDIKGHYGKELVIRLQVSYLALLLPLVAASRKWLIRQDDML